MPGASLPSARDDADQPAVNGVRDPELVRRAFGEQAIAAVGLLLDVRLDLLRVDADADLREAERHRPAFGDERQERALLLLVAVREQRAGADRELPRDLDRERAQAVRRQRFLDGGELAVRSAGTAERRGHRVAERFLRGDGAAQRGRQPRIGRECLAARERAERGIDDAALRARDALRKLGAGSRAPRASGPGRRSTAPRARCASRRACARRRARRRRAPRRRARNRDRRRPRVLSRRWSCRWRRSWRVRRSITKRRRRQLGA